MRVGFLGSGAWAMALIKLLNDNNHEVLLWSIEEDVLTSLEENGRHPRFEKAVFKKNLYITRNIDDLLDCDVLIESVTARGLRSVLNTLCEKSGLSKPFILSSKGIETDSEKILSEVAEEILGAQAKIGYISGPTLADGVLSGHPTCAVAGSKHKEIRQLMKDLFETRTFRLSSCEDIHGVGLGGAMKNIIAIATGMAAGLGFGFNTKAMLITVGLRELKKMAIIKNCRSETMDTFSGIGDLIVTGVTPLSRNYQFGKYLGEGINIEEAKKKIGMVVEGEYTIKAAYNLMKKSSDSFPITESIYNVLNKGYLPQDAIESILSAEVFV